MTTPLRHPTVITPDRRAAGQLIDLWRERELLRFLAWRDIQVRYKQTAFGAGWAVVQPVVAMLIFTLIFGHLARVPSAGVPYATFSYSGLVAWSYFSVTVGTSANSLVESQALITKVYFPRLLIPAAPVIANLVDLGIAATLMLGLAIVSGVGVHNSVIALPLVVLGITTAAFAAGVTLAAINVRYRDVRFALPFLIQIWLFATPVIYPSTLLSPNWRIVLGLNPMSGLVEALRWSVLGTPFPGWQLLVSVSTIVVALALGLRYFRRVESTFADVV